MFLVSLAMISLVVTSRRTVICVKRRKKKCSSADRSNHSRARSECTCRPQSSASQTLASRKFNVFINLFVREIYLRTFRNDEREAHSFGTWALAFHESSCRASKNEFADRTSLRSGLLFQPPVEGGRNVHGGANSFFLHEGSIPHMP